MGNEEVTSGQTQKEPQNLPAGWARTTIGEILTLEYGKSLVKANRAESGKYPVYGSSGIVGFHTEHLIKQPAIIVGRKGAAGAVHLCKKDFWPIDTTYFVKLNNSLSTDFIFYLLKFSRLQKYESSTAIPGLNRDHAYAEEVSLPPLAEQHRIVAKIEELFSELDKGVENLRTAQQQLKVYRQALLKHAFEGRLTADWRAQNPDKLESADVLLARIQQERKARYQQQLQSWQAAQQAWEANGKTGSKPSKPKAPGTLSPRAAEELAGLPELPKGWAWQSIEPLLSFERKPMATGPFGTLLSKPDYRSSGLPVLGIENIGDGVFIKGNKIFVSEEKALELSSFAVEPGDLIISRSGTVGEICKVPDNIGAAYISTNLIRVTLDKATVDPDYFVFLFQGGAVKQLVKDLCKGSSRAFLNQTILSAISFPIPCLEEQRMIVNSIEEKFSIIDQLEQTITHSLQQAEALRQSILKKAFSGQLVAQDANDEPASVLLERIKAEKQAKPAAGKPMPRTAPAALPSNVVPMPARIPGIASTDLHAGILALAYSAHEAEPKYLPYFGHVKGEKVSHLVEAHLGIELDRAPVKDAAGPNDYPHLKKVESRARKVGWFDMRREPGATAYSLHKLAGFNELQVKTRQALGSRLGEVEALLRLLLPLNTRQAEIVATLYAAWNNLLLDGHQPSDQQIIFEARDNWHPDKLKIEQERFEKGLSWMKAKGLVPNGQGRPVKSKPA